MGSLVVKHFKNVFFNNCIVQLNSFLNIQLWLKILEHLVKCEHIVFASATGLSFIIS